MFSTEKLFVELQIANLHTQEMQKVMFVILEENQKMFLLATSVMLPQPSAKGVGNDSRSSNAVDNYGER